MVAPLFSVAQRRPAACGTARCKGRPVENTRARSLGYSMTAFAVGHANENVGAFPCSDLGTVLRSPPPPHVHMDDVLLPEAQTGTTGPCSAVRSVGRICNTVPSAAIKPPRSLTSPRCTSSFCAMSTCSFGTMATTSTSRVMLCVFVCPPRYFSRMVGVSAAQ